jgi:hypothetical protein
MLFNIFVRFRSDPTMYGSFAQWPIMRDRRTKEMFVGSFVERWPTEYTARTLGSAVQAVYKKFGGQLERVEIRPVPPDSDY